MEMVRYYFTAITLLMSPWDGALEPTCPGWLPVRGYEEET
jgi:hypothetical protein